MMIYYYTLCNIFILIHHIMSSCGGKLLVFDFQNPNLFGRDNGYGNLLSILPPDVRISSVETTGPEFESLWYGRRMRESDTYSTVYPNF